MNSESEKVAGATGGDGDLDEKEAEKVDESAAGEGYTGPERRAQGYLIAEVVEGPEPTAPTRPSDFPA
jgi:hypothetical protein